MKIDRRFRKRDDQAGGLSSYDEFLIGRHPVCGIQLIGLLLVGTVLVSAGILGFAFVIVKMWVWESKPVSALMAMLFYTPVLYLGYLHLKRAFAGRK